MDLSLQFAPSSVQKWNESCLWMLCVGCMLQQRVWSVCLSVCLVVECRCVTQVLLMDLQLLMVTLTVAPVLMVYLAVELGLVQAAEAEVPRWTATLVVVP